MIKYIFGVFIIIGFMAGVFWFFSALPSAEQPSEGGFTQFPTGSTDSTEPPYGSDTPSFTPPKNTDMRAIETLITNNPSVVPDPQNQGVYLLHQNPSETQHDYVIEYHESDQTLSVLIQAEPIRFVRQQAEARVQTVLGVSQSEMCNLRYRVAVPYWISETYAGQNIGFSFCPGAVQF